MKKPNYSMGLPRLCLFVMLAVLGQVISGARADADVWPVTRDWSPEVEAEYRTWVNDNVDANLFVHRGRAYSGMLLDCADAVYSIRAIFAYENGLPFYMQDPSDSRRKITSQITKFDKIADPALRFRKFLTYLFGVVGTDSLANDSYPTAINREAVGSGTMIITDRDSHHSWTIQKVLKTGIPYLIFGSRPAVNRLYERVDIPSMEFMFHDNLTNTRAGFRNWRAPEDIGKPVWQAQGYSNEQYRIAYSKWRATVQKKLSTMNETDEMRLERLQTGVCTSAQERITIVQLGLSALAKLGADQCMNAKQFDDYSTPNRDKRMHDEFVDLIQAYKAVVAKNKVGSLSSGLRSSLREIIEVDAQRGGDLQSKFCRVNVKPGLSLSIGELRRRSLEGLLSSNPHDPAEARWGDTRFVSERARSCPVY